MNAKPVEIKILNWEPVAVWTFNASNNECTLCKNKITLKCVECLKIPNLTNCMVTKGKCGHAYHYHCIDKYTNRNDKNNQQICPTCFTPWNYEYQDLDKKRPVFVNKS